MKNSEIIGADKNTARPAPKILDTCCGGRMFWFDKNDSDVVYTDKRIETVIMKDKKAKGGYQKMHIRPSIQSDFVALPFKSNTFDLVVFDPPHLYGSGENCWLTKRYGVLKQGWETELAAGFKECFRVLRNFGTLIFKWNESDITVSKVLSLTSEKPLFGHKSGKASKTHWISFIKRRSHVLCEEISAV